MTALMPIRKGPYYQEKRQERILVTRQTSGRDPVSKRNSEKDSCNKRNIRKGPYEQGKYEEKTLIARETSGKNPISQRDIRKDPSRAVLRIRKYFFLIRIRKSVFLIYKLITDSAGSGSYLDMCCQTGNLPLNIIKF
jgi:hypothetical protein